MLRRNSGSIAPKKKASESDDGFTNEACEDIHSDIVREIYESNPFHSEGIFTPTTEKKSVTFSSTAGGKSADILSAADCLQYMRKGSALIKMHTGRKQCRTFYLDDQMRCIRWISSSKRHARAQIHLTELHDVQLGCSTKSTHSLNRRRHSSLAPGSNQSPSSNSTSSMQFANNAGSSRTISGSQSWTNTLPPPSSAVRLTLASCAFTITYGPDFETLELLANSPEEANIWVTGLKCLMTGAQDPHILEERQKPRDRWLQRLFSEADTCNYGYLEEGTAMRLIMSINPELSETHIRHQWKDSDFRSREQKGRLDVADFTKFYKKLVHRQEIYYILVRYASGAELLSQDDLRHFLDSEQGQIGVTAEQCRRYIEYFEPSPENRALGLMGIDGFTAFLLSRECDAFNATHLNVCQDMSQPITHYYLASSHKTFLLEDQLTGPCSIEGYRRALLSGCRYIEMEIYDGHDGYPVVRRANSRPPGIPIQVVLETISGLAFHRSDYPLIISVEHFLSHTQQVTLATMLRCCFGPRLLLPSTEFLFTLGDAQLEAEEHAERDFEGYRKNSVTTVNLSNETTVYSGDGMHVRWPSPRDLIGRILLKGKRLPKGTTGNVSTENMNGRGFGTRRFANYLPAHQSSAIAKELSDLFFFDCTNSSALPSSDTGNGSLSTKPKPLDARLYQYTRSTTANMQSTKFGSSLVVVGTHGEAGLPGRHSSKGVRSNTDKLRVHPYHVVQISESEASKALGRASGDLVQVTRNTMLEVIPSPSRADSSNINPVDIWAWGGQVVPLNYQTAGLVMDLATGFFARNGACGYVLKPSLYRTVSSFFNPTAEPSVGLHHNPPDTTPQIFRLRILSAQQLPKPRGSISKGDTIEPYVVVEIHGIPVDCAEQRTCTAPAGNASGYNATFDSTFEFCVQLGSLALVRFVVLDDQAIGDDFIGQNTIPFDCLLTGYRHVRLRSDTGEPIPQATLFIHVTITSRTEEGTETCSSSVLQRWRARKRQHTQLKKIGTSTFDDIFKSASSVVHQAVELRSKLLTAFDHFRRSCGETSSTMSMAQCIRTLASRMNAACGSPDAWPVRMRIRQEDELPHLELLGASPFFGSTLSVFPGLPSVGETTSVRNSSSRMSPAPSLQRSPSITLSSRNFFSRRPRRDNKSADDDTSSTLSIDVSSSSFSSNKGQQKEHSPTSISLPRRPSIHSSTSSISSLSTGGVEKMRRTVAEFESVIESAKSVIKQGPYLRVKLQQAQKSALEAYTSFLESMKHPLSDSNHSTRGEDQLGGPGDSSSLKRFQLLGTMSRRHDSNRTNTTSNPQRGETKYDAGSVNSSYCRKMSRTAESVTWNLRILTGQAELLSITLNELNTWLRQAREAGAASGLLIGSVASDTVEQISDKLGSGSSLSDPAQDLDSNQTTVTTKDITTTSAVVSDRTRPSHKPMTSGFSNTVNPSSATLPRRLLSPTNYTLSTSSLSGPRGLTSCLKPSNLMNTSTTQYSAPMRSVITEQTGRHSYGDDISTPSRSRHTVMRSNQQKF